MNIVEVNVANVFGVKELKTLPAGRNLVLIGGKNGNGKSSALNALMLALLGKRGWDCPDVILNKEAKNGFVKVKIDGCENTVFQQASITVEREIKTTKNGNVVDDAVRIVGDGGYEAPQPMKLLAAIVGTIGYDPLKFLDMKATEQAEALQKLVGVDFSELDKEYDKLYSERTILNREAERLQGAVDTAKKKIPEGIPDVPVDVVELSQQVEKANKHNAEKDRLIAKYRATKNEVEQAHAKVASLKADAESIARQIEALQRRAEENTKAAEAAQSVADTKVNELADVEAAGKAFVLIDTAPILDQIRQASETNALVAEKRRLASDVVALEQKRDEVNVISNRLRDIDEAKKTAIEEAKLPIENLTFNSNGVYLNGLPLNQACFADQLKVAIEVGSSQAGALPVMIAHRGESLDETSLQVVEDTCRRKKCQLWLEYVTHTKEDESKCAIVFRNGVGESN